MRPVICLCAAALLFAAGCSKTNDAARQDNPTPPAESPAPATPPPDQPPPASSENATPPPADQSTQQPPTNPPRQ